MRTFVSHEMMNEILAAFLLQKGVPVFLARSDNMGVAIGRKGCGITRFYTESDIEVILRVQGGAAGVRFVLYGTFMMHEQKYLLYGPETQKKSTERMVDLLCPPLSDESGVAMVGD